MNGKLVFRVWGRRLEFQGGPYHARTKGTVGIRLASEIRERSDFTVPCKDFGVPKMSDMEKGVTFAIKSALKGATIYAGCMGGIGRTGTFLACISKVLHGDDYPVGYVRSNYLSHAVETQDQQNLVYRFDARPIRKKLFWWAVQAWMGRLKP